MQTILSPDLQNTTLAHEALSAGRDAFHRVPDKASEARLSKMPYAKATRDLSTSKRAETWEVRTPRSGYAGDLFLLDEILCLNQGRGGTRP